MNTYSEDNFGGRALNWIMIAGAAALFALVTFESLAPQAVAPAQQSVESTANTSHA